MPRGIAEKYWPKRLRREVFRSWDKAVDYERRKANGNGESEPYDFDPETGEILGETPQADAPADRENFKLSEWLKLDLPPRDYLIGEVMCTTSRWIIFGETGVGKTLLASCAAGAIAAGAPFLGWEGRRRARVMYLDGEMPAETLKERAELVATHYDHGPDIALYFYNRDLLGLDEMPPLNTPKGQKWLWREIEIVKPDVIFFDSHHVPARRQHVGRGSSWEPVKGLIRQISSRRIAQIWLHHTGHDATKGYGTKTREWEMDTVVRLTKANDDPDDNSVVIDFTKARLRTPKNYKQFAARTIRMTEDGWVSEGAASVSRSGKDDDVEIIKREFLNSYERLARTWSRLEDLTARGRCARSSSAPFAMISRIAASSITPTASLRQPPRRTCTEPRRGCLRAGR